MQYARVIFFSVTIYISFLTLHVVGTHERDGKENGRTEGGGDEGPKWLDWMKGKEWEIKIRKKSFFVDRAGIALILKSVSLSETSVYTYRTTRRSIP
jgi:hypothetical protein